MNTAIFLLTAIFSHSAAANIEIRGRVFYEKISKEAPVFSFLSRIKSEPGGKRTIAHSFLDKDGKELAWEEGEFEGNRLLRFAYKQLQVGDHGEATVKNDRLEMSFTENAETKTDSEKVSGNLLVAPMITPLLNEKWDELMAGKTIKSRYVAVERVETIGFKFFKEKERNLNGKAAVDIIMKPSSLFIAALVSPIRITMSKEAPHWMMESNGRTPIRWAMHQPPRARSDWKAIDARIEYDPPKEIPAPQ